MNNNEKNLDPEVDAHLNSILVSYKTTVLQSLTDAERKTIREILLRDLYLKATEVDPQ